MTTFLFESIIFGPVNSRRLGASLGINLLPDECKLCNFDCIYCECGWTYKEKFKYSQFHPREEVKQALEEKLKSMAHFQQPLDCITFAGNGEPTMHPDFEGIINDTLMLRDQYFPEVDIAVLSNATLIHKKSVFDALNKIEQNILKLDSAFEETIQLIDQPAANVNIKKLVKQMKAFKCNLIIQTLFLRGTYNNHVVDNASAKEIDAWLQLLKEIRPSAVMVYTIQRDTPAENLEAIPADELHDIAKKVKNLGIDVSVSA
jgi:wyosine [tRNA(Phe)-imidazoG37] synthetase (radical SAM superfamily)